MFESIPFTKTSLSSETGTVSRRQSLDPCTDMAAMVSFGECYKSVGLLRRVVDLARPWNHFAGPFEAKPAHGGNETRRAGVLPRQRSMKTRRRVARKHFSSRRKSECELSVKCSV